MSSDKHRIIKLDVLKAFALIGVVLFQLGISENGYLGLDIFLVVNGFLIGKEISKSAHNNSLFYGEFLLKRIIKLFIPMFLCIIVSIAAGYMLMLPLDLKYLAEDAVASSFFLSNISACITGNNCLVSLSRLMPLAHLWFIGLLMQSYIVLPLVPMALKRVKKNRHTAIGLVYLALSVASLVLLFVPGFSKVYRFFLLPFRFFEIGFGATVACFRDEIGEFADRLKHNTVVISEFAVIVVLCVLLAPIKLGYTVRLLGVVAASVVFVALTTSDSYKPHKAMRIFSSLGAASYSVFIWLQPVVAFYSYAVRFELTLIDYALILSAVALLAVLTHLTAVRGIKKIDLYRRNITILIAFFAVLCCATSMFSYNIYTNDGIVDNIPELSIDMNTVQKHQLSVYENHAASMDSDFSKENKIKIVVYGYRGAYDFVNILLESPYSDCYNITYIGAGNDEQYMASRLKRLEEADCIFYCLSGNGFDGLDEALEKYYAEGKLYIVGNKYFGISNGIIYNHRYDDNYSSYAVDLPDEYTEQNDRLIAEYGDKYIDLISPVTNDEGKIRVFDDNTRFLSQDCRRLTKAGAEFYADRISFDFIEIPDEILHPVTETEDGQAKEDAAE